MKCLLRSALTVTLLLLTPWSAFAFGPSVNAVHFSGTGITSPNVFSPPTSGSTFFMSFWYNMNQRPTNGAELFSAQDITGKKLISVGFIGDQTSPYFEIDAIDSQGFCAHLDTQGPPGQPVFTMPFDGEWHSVILQVWVVGGMMRGQIALDGNIRTLAESAIFPFGQWAWDTVTHWNVGGSIGGGGYTGDMAEFYVDLDGSFVPAALSSLIVAQFRETISGLAPGLGIDGTLDSPGSQRCTGPSGLSPNICLRGGPCNFQLGPTILGQPAYVFTPTVPLPPNSARVITYLSDTDSLVKDPCLNVDIDFPGRFCPQFNNNPP